LPYHLRQEKVLPSCAERARIAAIAQGLQLMPDSHTGPHWSTDYVEHIRTVHFTLIAVCVALFVLSTSRAQTDVQIAHEQIRQIREFLGTPKKEGPTYVERPIHYVWLSEAARSNVNEWSSSPGLYGKYPGELVVTLVNDSLEFSHDGATWRGRLDLLDDQNYLWDWKPRRSTDDSLPDPREQRSTVEIVRVHPETLEQFRNLWDLTGHLFLDLPIAVSTTAFVYGQGFYEDRTPFWDSITLNDAKVAHDALVRESVGVHPVLHLREFSQEQIKHLLVKDPAFRAKLSFSGFVYPVEQNRGPLSVWIPISRYVSIPFDAQSLLISHAKKEWDWKHGQFDYSFRQLSAITKEYPTINIETCEQVLASEEKRGGESFEALGIRFPAENTTRWGILVIIGIQIYFWIHLRELKPKLRRNDPGWDVAWIGVYTSNYAKVAMFVLTCLLPLAAALALGIRGLQVSSFAKTNWALLVFGSAATLTLGILAWMRLPSMEEPH